MSYIVAVLVVGGALDEDVEFDTEKEFNKWLEKVKTDEADCSSAAGEVWEVYRLDHSHSNDGKECMCVQFLTDHHAYWSNEPK